MLYRGALTAVIAVLTVGLAWGIRPAILFLLWRMNPRRRELVASLLQTFIILGGMAFIITAAGVHALLWVMTVSAALLVGVRIGRENIGPDRMTSRVFHSPSVAQSKATAVQNSRIMTQAKAVAVLDSTDADATAHGANDADRTEIAATESAVPPHSLPVTPIAQSAESVPARRSLLQHTAAVPLTRRRGLGKRTVQAFR
ncbi:MAG: hypothetical protein R2911_44825 [Caldilineaceae bacterium]